MREKSLWESRSPSWSLSDVERFRREYLVPQEKAGLGRKKFVDTQGLWTTGLLVQGEGTLKAPERKVQVIKRNHLGQTGSVAT